MVIRRIPVRIGQTIAIVALLVLQIGLRPGASSAAMMDEGRTLILPTNTATTTGSWLEYPPPMARSDAVMAYSDVSQTVMLFSGITMNDSLGDTWTWNGTTWSQQFPSTSPLPRYDAAMVYDAAHNVDVLFGGYPLSDGGPVDETETWTWDGATWTQMFPATSPTIGAFSGGLSTMVYDEALQKVVVFENGFDSLGNLVPQTWLWDGSTWTQQITATVPPFAYQTASLAYDAARQKVVLYDGDMQTTWTFDGTDWAATSSTSGPPIGGPMVYDAATQTVVLLENDVYGMPSSTWSWDGTAWTRLTTSASPPGRFDDAIVYDATSQTILIFGGSTSGFPVDEMWSWDGATWMQKNPSPAARTATSMAYQSATGSMVLFGGQGIGSKPLADTWLLTNSRWKKARPTISPPARFNASMTYDALHHATVLFGGGTCAGRTCPTSSIFGDTWLWTGTTWVQPPLATAPPARRSSSLVYNPATRSSVLFGGLTAGGQPLGDTWTWNGASWTLLQPQQSPSPRWGASLAFDPATRLMMLFGGCADNGCQTVLNDTWAWNGITWTRMVPVASPSSRNQASMAFSASRQAIVLFGGLDSSRQVLGDTWAWNGTTWAPLTLTTSPAPRASASMVYNAGMKAILFFGGTQPSEQQSSDAWSLR